MKKLLLASLLSLVLLQTGNIQAADKQKLMETGTSWNGNEFKYPKGKEKVTAFYVTMEKGERLPFHCHPVPTIGYLISGHLEVETRGGKTKTFQTGDAVSEVMNTWHRGTNLSQNEEVKLVVFYLGSQTSGPNSILYNEENKDKCKD